MHDGYTKLTKKQVIATFVHAVSNSLVCFCLIFLYYYNMYASPTSTIATNHFMATVCMFLFGLNINKTIRSWKRWNSEYKELKGLNSSNVIN